MRYFCHILKSWITYTRVSFIFIRVVRQKPEIATSFYSKGSFFLAVHSEDLNARGVESNDRKSRERLFEDTWCQAIRTKTDEPGTAESHGGGERERKRFLRIIINGPSRSGANDFIAKCVTAGINDPAIIPSFGFLCASDFCGKDQARTARARKCAAPRDRYNVTDSWKSLSN